MIDIIKLYHTLVLTLTELKNGTHGKLISDNYILIPYDVPTSEIKIDILWLKIDNKIKIGFIWYAEINKSQTIIKNNIIKENNKIAIIVMIWETIT